MVKESLRVEPSGRGVGGRVLRQFGPESGDPSFDPCAFQENVSEKWTPVLMDMDTCPISAELGSGIQFFRDLVLEARRFAEAELPVTYLANQ